MIKSFESLLDVISESYFGIVESSADTSKKKKGRFQFSTLDLLVSPLRQDIQFGISIIIRIMEHQGYSLIRIRDMQIWEEF